MSQIYNRNTKRPEPKENQLGILGFRKSARDLGNFHILLEIQERALDPGECAASTTYLSLRICPKSCYLIPLKVVQLYLVVEGRAQLEHSNHIVKVSVEATC